MYLLLRLCRSCDQPSLGPAVALTPPLLNSAFGDSSRSSELDWLLFILMKKLYTYIRKNDALNWTVFFPLLQLQRKETFRKTSWSLLISSSLQASAYPMLVASEVTLQPSPNALRLSAVLHLSTKCFGIRFRQRFGHFRHATYTGFIKNHTCLYDCKQHIWYLTYVMASLTQVWCAACHLVASHLEEAASERGTSSFGAKTVIAPCAGLSGGDAWWTSVFTSSTLTNINVTYCDHLQWFFSVKKSDGK